MVCLILIELKSLDHDNENGKIKFGDLSCAIKCEDMDDKYIKEMLKKSVENQFEIAK